MTEIVNLNRARKARARAEAVAKAAANRAAHGRTRAERETSSAEETRRRALLDGARLDEVSPSSPSAFPPRPSPP